MVDKYKENKIIWKIMAKVALKGFIYDYDLKTLHYNNSNYCIIKLVLIILLKLLYI